MIPRRGPPGSDGSRCAPPARGRSSVPAAATFRRPELNFKQPGAGSPAIEPRRLPVRLLVIPVLVAGVALSGCAKKTYVQREAGGVNKKEEEVAPELEKNHALCLPTVDPYECDTTSC